jgi:hypothetical protein
MAQPEGSRREKPSSQKQIRFDRWIMVSNPQPILLQFHYGKFKTKHQGGDL